MEKRERFVKRVERENREMWGSRRVRFWCAVEEWVEVASYCLMFGLSCTLGAVVGWVI